MTTIFASNSSQSGKNEGKSGAFGNQPGAGLFTPATLNVSNRAQTAIAELSAKYFKAKGKKGNEAASKEFISSINKALR